MTFFWIVMVAGAVTVIEVADGATRVEAVVADGAIV
jgi:hypothetical protein